MPLCCKCANCNAEQLVSRSLCAIDYWNPVTGEKIELTTYHARCYEWACGAEGRGWQPKDAQYRNSSLDVAAPVFGPEPQYVLLSDLAAEFGEERVREWAKQHWSHAAETTDTGDWKANAGGTLFLRKLWMYRVPIAVADEFRRAMKEQKPQAQNCPLCRSAAHVVDGLAMCSKDGCEFMTWVRLKIWNRINLAPEKEETR